MDHFSTLKETEYSRLRFHLLVRVWRAFGSPPDCCCCLREWVENQRESVRLSVRPRPLRGRRVERRADWRGAQFMEECYGYERNKMAMVIGVMDEDLQSCVPEFHCPSVPCSHPIQVVQLCVFLGRTD